MSMTLIQTVTVGAGGSASIEFGAGGTIPQIYTDLFIQISARTNRAFTIDSLKVEFNGLTSGLSNRELYGSGADTGSATGTTFKGGFTTGANATSNTFGSSSIYIPNYRSSNSKSGSIDGVSENNAQQAFQVIVASLWTGTAAITSIKLLPEVGTLFSQYSSASLYGITAGSDGIVTVS